jgi:hypothetical protein
MELGRLARLPELTLVSARELGQVLYDVVIITHGLLLL